jgi:hypothetical protein
VRGRRQLPQVADALTASSATVRRTLRLITLRAQLAASEKQRAAVSDLLVKAGAVLARKVDASDLGRTLNDLIPRHVEARSGVGLTLSRP